MSSEGLDIIAYDIGHRSDLLDLAIRAWIPVFPRMKADVPSFVYDSFYPDGWEMRQYAELAAVLDLEPENVDIAVLEDEPVGWVCTRLHPEDSMGEVYLIVVNPSRQGMSVGRALLERAYERARTAGMRMIMVETGDDSGHGPARALYESDGFVRWPVARYFKELQSGQ
ncbi:MAG TPA: GNAT family N-acetyltransferase [Candidatus Yaniella excrementigallinarum]|nr:GNAT family N-acetyltransferase [Candidatus Yaniella excrementigallinarum]